MTDTPQGPSTVRAIIELEPTSYKELAQRLRDLGTYEKVTNRSPKYMPDLDLGNYIVRVSGLVETA